MRRIRIIATLMFVCFILVSKTPVANAKSTEDIQSDIDLLFKLTDESWVITSAGDQNYYDYIGHYFKSNKPVYLSYVEWPGEYYEDKKSGAIVIVSKDKDILYDYDSYLSEKINLSKIKSRVDNLEERGWWKTYMDKNGQYWYVNIITMKYHKRIYEMDIPHIILQGSIADITVNLFNGKLDYNEIDLVKHLKDPDFVFDKSTEDVLIDLDKYCKYLDDSWIVSIPRNTSRGKYLTFKFKSSNPVYIGHVYHLNPNGFEGLSSSFYIVTDEPNTIWGYKYTYCNEDRLEEYKQEDIKITDRVTNSCIDDSGKIWYYIVFNYELENLEISEVPIITYLDTNRNFIGELLTGKLDMSKLQIK